MTEEHWIVPTASNRCRQRHRINRLPLRVPGGSAQDLADTYLRPGVATVRARASAWSRIAQEVVLAGGPDPHIDESVTRCYRRYPAASRILACAQAAGVELVVRGGRLRWWSLWGRPSAGMLMRMREHQDEIVALLHHLDATF